MRGVLRDQEREERREMRENEIKNFFLSGLRDHDRSRSIVKCTTPRSIKGVCAPDRSSPDRRSIEADDQ